MTKRLIIGLMLAFLPLLAQAQDGTFQATRTKPPVLVKKPENPGGEKLRARNMGVVVMMSQRGLQVISPFAPAELGRGERILTAGQALEKRPASAVEDPKPFGGITLYGVEF